jgi:hypothetical protein
LFYIVQKRIPNYSYYLIESSERSGIKDKKINLSQVTFRKSYYGGGKKGKNRSKKNINEARVLNPHRGTRSKDLGPEVITEEISIEVRDQGISSN